MHRFGPLAATAAFAIYGINGFGGFFREKERPDERDKSIARRATLAGAMASYGAFILGCMGTWAVVHGLGKEEQVSVHALGTITMFGAITFFFVRSVAILVHYGRHVEGENV